MSDDMLDHYFWEDDDYDEEGGEEGWVAYARRQKEERTCLFPGECVMGHCEHHRDECLHFDDAAAHYEMLEAEFNSTIDETK